MFLTLIPIHMKIGEKELRGRSGKSPKFERLNVAPLLAEVIRAVYLNQSVSPCYNLITPEVQAKKKEEVEKIMKEKEVKKL
ncbi:hypothetical protein AV274_0110 [Blastocystis sp. ATCC 50177/Nand II]|uniref:Uncharacterized protein n=1 Tax=Blastocystis sp. subtype 1 (strain ATCC 50177 / NandII) TaxID=478820 RepID=A0A196SPM1_BLAHN|nr:hypothetical protein AV274_0110 [Blastocystis sp. ATCC 50177/Nand II]